MFTTTWRNKIQAFELSTSDWVQERPSEVLGAEHVRWVKSSDPDSEAAGPRVNGWIDGWTDAKATAEQVKQERSSLTCQNDVYCGWGRGERHDIIMPANRGSQCQSNLQPENTWLRKAMNMIRPSNRCSLTHPSEKTCVSERSGSEGIQLIFPVCIWENRRYDVQCPTFLQLFDRAHNEANLHQLKKEKKVSLGTTTPIFM